MSYLQNQMNVLKFDKRLLEMNLKNGTISESEYNQHLSALADVEKNATKLDLAAEADDAMREKLNGSHGSGGSQKISSSMPANNDPFGSGF